MYPKPRCHRSRKDYPKGVMGIYDNGGKTFDRYTVVFEPVPVLPDASGKQAAKWFFPYLGMSQNPFHPQGFGQHGELNHRYTRGKGEKVINFQDLPEDCRKAVKRDLQTS